MIRRSSSPVSTESGVQAWSPSSGMNSMKRTWKAVERANSANGSACSSVKPRIATAFTLIGWTSGCRASASSPRSTCGIELEQVAVGGQGEVAQPLDPRQHPDKLGELAPHERLATRQADVLDPHPDEQPHQPLDLLEAEQLRPLEPGQPLGR